MLRTGVMLGLALFGVLRLLGHLTDPRLSDREIRRIVGEPARVTAPRDAPWDAPTVKLVTWNIRHGRAFEGILETLRRLDADAAWAEAQRLNRVPIPDAFGPQRRAAGGDVQAGGRVRV